MQIKQPMDPTSYGHPLEHGHGRGHYPASYLPLSDSENSPVDTETRALMEHTNQASKVDKKKGKYVKVAVQPDSALADSLLGPSAA